MGWNCDHISCLSSAPLVRKVAQDIECIAFPAKGFQDGFQIEDGGGENSCSHMVVHSVAAEPRPVPH